jgi:hypothetical protein
MRKERERERERIRWREWSQALRSVGTYARIEKIERQPAAWCTRVRRAHMSECILPQPKIGWLPMEACHRSDGPQATDDVDPALIYRILSIRWHNS